MNDHKSDSWKDSALRRKDKRAPPEPRVREVTMSLMDIVEVRRLVKAHFDGDEDKTAQWMSTRNPLLGNASPEEMVAVGREDKLLAFVKAQLEENENG